MKAQCNHEQTIKSKQFFCQSVEEKTKCIKPDGEFSGWIGLEKEK
jgi:isopenicillin N synthase-like dioxygenase